MAGKRITCDLCGRTFAPGYFQAHRRRSHGIRGGKTGIPRVRKIPTSELTAIAGSNGVVLRFRVTEFVVLIDQNGQLWVAERLAGITHDAE